MIVAAATRAFGGPLCANDATAIAAFRALLEQHGFTTPRVYAALGPALRSQKQHLRDDLPLYLRRLAAPTPLNTLIKLFTLDCSVDENAAARAVAPLGLDHLQSMGLIECRDRQVRALVRLSAHDGLLVAHDGYDDERRRLKPDHVLDVNPTTLTLQHLVVRRPVRRALEIGTGCGVLALKAARHADQVIATDTNPRALNFAAFNAALNEISNVEWRLGSLFDAVAGERFDLIFSNPPYVISPDNAFIFRDGGRRGDALCEEIIRGIPEHLHPGGFATVLVNWALGPHEEWSAPLRRWIDGNGCDTWLMLSGTQDPLTYAALWNRTRDRVAYEDALDRWMAYFASLGLDSIGLGAVVLRKRAWGTPWVRADQILEPVTAAAGAHIERLFEAEDRLYACPDAETLLAERFVLARDHRLHQTLEFADDGYSIHHAEVLLTNGLPLRGAVDPYTVQLVSRCDGRRTLHDIAGELAASAGLEQLAFARACAQIARRLVAAGFLVPVPHAERSPASPA